MSDLNVLRAQIAAELDKHRGTSTRNINTGEYKNPVRQGYDMGLSKALELIDQERK